MSPPPKIHPEKRAPYTKNPHGIKIALPPLSVKEAGALYRFLENIAQAIWQTHHGAFFEYPSMKTSALCSE